MASSAVSSSTMLVRWQEPLHRLVLAFEHLGEQVLRHRLLGGAVIEREAPGVRALLDRVGDQPEAGRPSLGPFVDGEDVAVRHVQPVRLEELGGLGEPEEEVRVPASRSGDPRPRSRPIRRGGSARLAMSSSSSLGSPLDQPAERGDRTPLRSARGRRRARAPMRCPASGELVERVVEHRRSPSPPLLSWSQRADPAERIEDRSDETTRKVVARLDGHPRDRDVVGAVHPAGEQRGLAGPRRCRHQRHRATPALGQQLVEAGSRHDGLGQTSAPTTAVPRSGALKTMVDPPPGTSIDAMCPASTPRDRRSTARVGNHPPGGDSRPHPGG